MKGQLLCVCGCEIEPHEIRAHHQRCSRIKRAKRRLNLGWLNRVAR